MEINEIKIIGLGGIGSNLILPLARYVETRAWDFKPNIVVIDGDSYEAKNADRQEFLDVGKKAEVTKERIQITFPSLVIESKPDYVTEENIFVMVNSGDVVFLGVDNHATRKLVSDHCETLENVVLISGGNELTDGNVQVYIRKEGLNVTPPITHLHPEIKNPEDKNPSELSCEELANSGVPQLIFTNLTASVHMLNAFWMVVESGKILYNEVCFDISTGRSLSYLRNAVGNKEGK